MSTFPFSLFDIGGRLSRGRYWALSIANSLYFVAIVLTLLTVQPAASDLWGVGLFAALVSSMVLGVFAMIRRLHDVGRSGWWVVYFASPVVAIVGPLLVLEVPERIYLHVAYLPMLAALVLAHSFFGLKPSIDISFTRGESGPNRYGLDPLARKHGG